GRSVIQKLEIAIDRVEAPDPRDDWRLFIFIELRIEVGRSITRTIRREQDPAIGSVNRRNVIEVGGLVRYLLNDWSLILTQPADLVHLPVIGRADLKLLRRRTDHHAEESLRSGPVHARLAHGDPIRTLKP